ncbi:MAG TPA: xanthine dehydrogenase family protein molybdopterin-binding subunit, partial [Thermoanaerobaculia bacterium]|nr:xanthine dehydrogenase family protein molybdopterin-binding subunit [Thermoanaerobaculia bacterium]
MSEETIRIGFNGKFESKKVSLAEGDPAPWDPVRKFSILGSPVPRLDAHAKVTGQARYSIDVRLPGMLYGKILRCPHAAAVVRSVDLSAARKMPGVKAALPIVAPGEMVRFAGQEIAAVAADTPERAIDALGAIVVVYEPSPFVVDLEEAKKPGAPLVLQPRTGKKTGDPYAEELGGKGLSRKGNIQGPRRFEKGNIAEGFRRSDVIVEGTYVTQVQTHTALETH